MPPLATKQKPRSAKARRGFGRLGSFVGAKRSSAVARGRSSQADLGEDALAGEQLGAEPDHEAEHGQAAIPGFGEGNETEAGGGVSHGVGEET